jgi:hypothetical protein
MIRLQRALHMPHPQHEFSRIYAYLLLRLMVRGFGPGHATSGIPVPLSPNSKASGREELKQLLLQFGPGGCGPGGFGPGGPRGFGRGGLGPGGPWRGSPGRGRRGDVRAACLALLAKRPRDGYQLIREIAERRDQLWRPSTADVPGPRAARGRGPDRAPRPRVRSSSSSPTPDAST